MKDWDIGDHCDILISNDKDYDVEKLICRLNLIKVLISSDEDSRYDICLEKSDNYADDLLKAIKEKYL